MKTSTTKKATTSARLRRVAVRPNTRRKVKMPDFMKNLRAACGNQSFDKMFARVEAGL